MYLSGDKRVSGKITSKNKDDDIDSGLMYLRSNNVDMWLDSSE